MDEAALEARANDERAKIFERYDRGREDGAEIDEWEDPSLEIYHTTDRYGFIHDTRLPNKRDHTEQKAIGIERIREMKWRKMKDNWKKPKTQEVLHRRIYKGIPASWRPAIWIKLLNIEETMRETDKKDVYQNMLALSRQYSTEARQIDSDVNRQFRDHMFYRERYSEKQKSLFNVLTAYSMYNMEVSVCLLTKLHRHTQIAEPIENMLFYRMIRLATVKVCPALLAFSSCTWTKNKHSGHSTHCLRRTSMRCTASISTAFQN